jgi:hypothetical protein
MRMYINDTYLQLLSIVETLLENVRIVDQLTFKNRTGAIIIDIFTVYYF